MAFYGSDSAWSGPARQSSWDQQQPSLSGPGPALLGSPPPPSSFADTHAFAAQFEEIERATDNLMKSGKWGPGQAAGGASARRDSLPQPGRGLDFSADSRMGGGPPTAARHQAAGSASVADFDPSRPGSAGLQGFYQGQRFPGSRQSEAEQVLQNKRRMAAQRERELRNYHQEQQYHRTVSGGKPTERAMSPNTMSDDDRRELIARQHRALYGETAALYTADGEPVGAGASHQPNQDVRGHRTGRGQSPLDFDAYGAPPAPGSATDSGVQMPAREAGEGVTSPAPAQQPFPSRLHDPQQSSRTSTSSQGGSPPLGQTSKGVAPIGTRPAATTSGVSAAPNSKRSTTPLAPSGLSHGIFTADAKEERSASAAPNQPLSATAAEKSGVPGLGGWGSNSGVWGSGKSTLAVQPSVWG